jgi:hypothetical protein
MTGRVSSDAAREILTRAFLSEKRGPGAIRRFHRMALSPQASGSPTGVPERCRDRGNGRSLSRPEANPDLKKVVFPFYNDLK